MALVVSAPSSTRLPQVSARLSTIHHGSSGGERCEDTSHCPAPAASAATFNAGDAVLYAVNVRDEYGNRMKYDDGTDCTLRIVPTKPAGPFLTQPCASNKDGTQNVTLSMTKAGHYRVLVFLGGNSADDVVAGFRMDRGFEVEVAFGTATSLTETKFTLTPSMGANKVLAAGVQQMRFFFVHVRACVCDTCACVCVCIRVCVYVRAGMCVRA